MDFYLTDSIGIRIHFPINPENIPLSAEAKIETHESMELGDIALPRGNVPDKIQMQGVFPGVSRSRLPFVKDWKEPNILIAQIKQWKESGVRLRYLVTETCINQDVYIQSFESKWSGGYGDAEYTLSLVQARDIYINLKGSSESQNLNNRPATASPSTYTVVSGDCLYLIAKRYGKSLDALYAANRTLIGPDPNKIYPGQVLTIPA